MPKITKHAEFLEQLRGMVTKTSEAGKVTGKPGADTHYTSTSESTEHVNKNEQGHPEKNPQDFKQEPSKDKSDPTKTHKKAEDTEVTKDATEAEKTEETKTAAVVAPQVPDTGKPEVAKDATNKTEQTAAKTAEDASENLNLAALGKQLLEAIKTAQAEDLNKEAKAGKVTGKPGADTHYTSVSAKTDTVNKNNEGNPEDNPQEFKQEKAKDPSDPTKKHAEQEELDKQASFELGRQFCRSFLQTKTAANTEVYKEAGRKDFETLIAQAASELGYNKQAQVVKKAEDAALLEKQAAEQAEQAGAEAFYALYKQAQEEYQAEQVKLAFEQRLNKLAEEKAAVEKKAAELEATLKAKEAEMQKKAEREERAAEFASWSQHTVNEVISRLRSESDK